MAAHPQPPEAPSSRLSNFTHPLPCGICSSPSTSPAPTPAAPHLAPSPSSSQRADAESPAAAAASTTTAAASPLVAQPPTNDFPHPLGWRCHQCHWTNDLRRTTCDGWLPFVIVYFDDDDGEYREARSKCWHKRCPECWPRPGDPLNSLARASLCGLGTAPRLVARVGRFGSV